MAMTQCCEITRKGARCPIHADRERGGCWYCHVHDPDGKNMQAIRAKMRFPNRPRAIARIKAEIASGTVEPRRMVIRPPGIPTEFEVQSFLFNALLQCGLTVRGEVPASLGTSRFDLVVFDGKTAVHIIEVKKCQQRDVQGRRARARQIDKYSAYGVPVTVVVGMKQAERFIDQVRQGQIEFSAASAAACSRPRTSSTPPPTVPAPLHR